MHYRKDGIKITGIKYVDEYGTQYPVPKWFDGATDDQLISLGITRHDTIIPAYDPLIQYMAEQTDGSYLITDYTQTEIDARKVQIVTMRQARLALLSVGLLTSVDQAISAMDSPQKEAALIEWEYSATVDKNSPLVSGLISGLGLSSQQIDDLFESASKIL